MSRFTFPPPGPPLFSQGAALLWARKAEFKLVDLPVSPCPAPPSVQSEQLLGFLVQSGDTPVQKLAEAIPYRSEF